MSTAHRQSFLWPQNPAQCGCRAAQNAWQLHPRGVIFLLHFHLSQEKRKKNIWRSKTAAAGDDPTNPSHPAALLFFSMTAWAGQDTPFQSEWFYDSLSKAQLQVPLQQKGLENWFGEWFTNPQSLYVFWHQICSLKVFLTVLHQWRGGVLQSLSSGTWNWKKAFNWPKFYVLHQNSNSTGWKADFFQGELCPVTHMSSAVFLAFGIAQSGGPKPETFPPCLWGRGLYHSIRNYF